MEYLKKLKENENFKNIVLFTIFSFAIFTIVLLAYWPGILVSDSMVQWNQIQTGAYDSWHPVYNTLYMSLLAKIWNNPGFILWIQCFWLSLSVGCFFTKLVKYFKINKIYLVIFTVIFAIIPLNYNFAVTLLKDTIYSTFVIFLMSIILDLICDKNYSNQKINFVLSAIVCLLVSLFRHNGILVSIVFFIMYCILLRKDKKAYISFGCYIIIYIFMNTVMFNVLDIQKNDYANKYAPFSHIIADMLNNKKVKFDDKELEFLEKYVDVEKLKQTYHLYNMDYSINCQNTQNIIKSGKKYAKYVINKSMDYPSVAIKHYLKLTSYLYSPVPFKDEFTVGMFVDTDLWIYNDIYPWLNSKIPSLKKKLIEYEQKYQDPEISNYTLRPAIYMYATIIMLVIICIIKKNKKIILLALPTVTNIISLAPAIPVPMVRYVYSTMIAFYIIFVWFIHEIFILLKNRKEVKK